MAYSCQHKELYSKTILFDSIHVQLTLLGQTCKIVKTLLSAQDSKETEGFFLIHVWCYREKCHDLQTVMCENNRRVFDVSGMQNVIKYFLLSHHHTVCFVLM